jgi:hypothetical protein
VTIQAGAAIQPVSVELAPGATFLFEIFPWGDPMVWSVVGGDAHGTITEWGEYTAPATPGVYRVQAVSGAWPAVFAAITVR